MNHEIQPVEKHKVEAELVSMDMAPPRRVMVLPPYPWPPYSADAGG